MPRPEVIATCSGGYPYCAVLWDEADTGWRWSIVGPDMVLDDNHFKVCSIGSYKPRSTAIEEAKKQLNILTGRNIA